MQDSINVAVIGVGNMGAPMAGRLIERGYTITVRDLRPEATAPLAAAGASVAASSADAAHGADVLLLVVVDAIEIDAVLFSGPQPAADALRPGATVVLHSTIAPHDARRFGRELGHRGFRMVDAPISGGPARARCGTLSIMVSGCKDACSSVEPILRDLGNNVFCVGAEIGQGATMKLVNNLLAGVNLAAAAEAFAIGARVGIDSKTMLAVIRTSSGSSWMLDDRMHRVLEDDRSVRAHLRILAKDTALAVAMAQQLQMSVAIGANAEALFASAVADGWGDRDDSALFAYARERARCK